MDELDAGAGLQSAPPPPGGQGGAAAAIAALRELNADRLDPVRFRFIEALASRARAHDGAVRRYLDERLSQALHDYRARYHDALSAARARTANAAESRPDAAGQQTALDGAGDADTPQGAAAGPKKYDGCAALTELLRQLARQSPDAAETHAGGDAGRHPDLKTVARFRSTWSKLSADRLVAQSLEQAPENAGPINSHSLVLRSLALMREIAPDYLGRFMCQVETLLWLEQADAQRQPVAKSRARPKRQK
ncbi:MAG: DUF2894 domain-containing protein [Rhodocyclaceae bacterium]|nr:DUF2894 domain-containing protein [Rhodocyclaceae bacterium]